MEINSEKTVKLLLKNRDNESEEINKNLLVNK